MSVPRLRRTVALTPSDTSWRRNASTPAGGVPGVANPGVGLRGIRFTWARSERAMPASSRAETGLSFTPSMSAHSNDNLLPLAST